MTSVSSIIDSSDISWSFSAANLTVHLSSPHLNMTRKYSHPSVGGVC